MVPGCRVRRVHTVICISFFFSFYSSNQTPTRSRADLVSLFLFSSSSSASSSSSSLFIFFIFIILIIVLSLHIILFPWTACGLSNPKNERLGRDAFHLNQRWSGPGDAWARLDGSVASMTHPLRFGYSMTLIVSCGFHHGCPRYHHQ